MKKIYLVALAIALIVGIAVFSFASSLQAEAKGDTNPQREVVVAIVAIPENTAITAEMVKLKAISVDAVHSQMLVSLKDAIGMISGSSVAAGEPLMRSRLEKSTVENDRLSYALEEGYRAITVEASKTSGVDGYITEGDHVDLICNGIVGEENVSKFQVQNLLVLRLGSKMAEDGTTYATITFSATTEDALKINNAFANYDVSFVLRSVADDKITDQKPYAEPTTATTAAETTPAPTITPTIAPADNTSTAMTVPTETKAKN